MDWSKANPKMMSMFGQSGSVFGVLLPEMAKEDSKIMVVSADMSTPAGLDKFKAAYPEQFLNFGIAEQNMIGAGAGLADEGYTVVAEAQACFVTMRCYEQLRQYCGYMGCKMIVVGILSGYSLTYMGNTHYALEDIALMRTIPGMNVIAPCDALEAMKAFEAAIVNEKPTYIRLFGSTGTPIVHRGDFQFEIGKTIKLIEGKDIQIVATGSMVSTALKVAERLSMEGISVDLIDMHTVSPLDVSVLKRDVNKIFTIEEHRATGGLGDAVAAYIAEAGDFPRLIKIAAPDRFGKVGDYSYLLEENNLSVDKIFETIKNNI